MYATFSIYIQPWKEKWTIPITSDDFEPENCITCEDHQSISEVLLTIVVHYLHLQKFDVLSLDTLSEAH